MNEKTGNRNKRIITLYALVFDIVRVASSVVLNAEFAQLVIYRERNFQNWDVSDINGFTAKIHFLLAWNTRRACCGCLRVRSFLAKHCVTKLSQIEQPAGEGRGHSPVLDGMSPRSGGWEGLIRTTRLVLEGAQGIHSHVINLHDGWDPDCLERWTNLSYCCSSPQSSSHHLQIPFQQTNRLPLAPLKTNIAKGTSRLQGWRQPLPLGTPPRYSGVGAQGISCQGCETFCCSLTTLANEWMLTQWGKLLRNAPFWNMK
jgi:hypothetical protein